LALLAGPWVAAARCETVGARLAEMPPENVARTLAILELAGVLPTEPIVRESATLYADAFQLVLQMKTRKLIVSRAGVALGLEYSRSWEDDDSDAEEPECLKLSPAACEQVAGEIAKLLGRENQGWNMKVSNQRDYNNYRRGPEQIDISQSITMHGIEVPTGLEVSMDTYTGLLCSFSMYKAKLPEPEAPIISEAEARRLALSLATKDLYWFYTVTNFEAKGQYRAPSYPLKEIPMPACEGIESKMYLRSGEELWRKSRISTIVYKFELAPWFFAKKKSNVRVPQPTCWIDAFTGERF